MKKCIRCGVDGRDVRLFDAIYDGRMENLCERCSLIENIPIIKRPDSGQLKKSESKMRIYGKNPFGEKESESFFIEDKINELNQHPELELPEKKKLNLIEHFHWVIMKARRFKKLSQKQLADYLGEPEIVVDMIEKGKLPENAEILIRKLEQFFQIKLRKISETEKIHNRFNQGGVVLLDKKGNELDKIPETDFESINEKVEEESYFEEKTPEIHCKIEKKQNSSTPYLDDSAVVECKIDKPVLNQEELEIKRVNPNAVTIADLKELTKRKIEATKMEKIEEQRRMEERQRLIEAKKEELRLLREKESKELDNVLGGKELLEEKKEFVDFDKDLI